MSSYETRSFLAGATPDRPRLMVLIIGSLLAPGPAYAGAHSPMASHSNETPPRDSPVDLAHQHLVEVMDQYHLTFDVYTDIGAAGNHFVHRAMTGSDVTIDDTYTGTVHTGASAIRNTFTALGSNWGGWFFRNGVLLYLSPGWNLVGIPYPPNFYSASTLLAAIASQGGACSEVDRFINGGWSAYVGLPFNDFPIRPTEGVFLKCSQSSIFVPG